MTTSYPLAWPEGWPRSTAREDGRRRFIRRGAAWTFGAARDALYEELDRLGSPPHITLLSSNYRLNQRGEPSKAYGRPADEGVAVYFQRRGRPYVMACDRFLRAEENMRSLTLAIDAMRALERHGGGVMMERAFAGFAALPSPGSTPWWSVLQVDQAATREQIEVAFRRLARERHPDSGGSDAMMADLNRARDEARRARQ